MKALISGVGHNFKPSISFFGDYYEKTWHDSILSKDYLAPIHVFLRNKLSGVSLNVLTTSLNLYLSIS